MVRTLGEVSRIEAAAQQGRAWFRDLAIMVFGLFNDKSLITGKPTPMTPHFKRLRLSRHEKFIEKHTQFIEKDVLGNPWQSVDTIAFAGVMWNRGEYEALLDRLDALRLQVAMVVDFPEGAAFERLRFGDASLAALGRMKSPLKDFTLPDPLLVTQD